MAFNDTDYQWMRLALDEARLSAKSGEVPVGAVLLDRDGELLARGHNQPISSHDASAHAELVVIREACRVRQNYRLPGSTLYVTLEPCTMCWGAMIHARIGRLVYAATEPRAGVCESQLQLPQQGFYNHRLTVESGLLADESSHLLREFFASRRRG